MIDLNSATSLMLPLRRGSGLLAALTLSLFAAGGCKNPNAGADPQAGSAMAAAKAGMATAPAGMAPAKAAMAAAAAKAPVTAKPTGDATKAAAAAAASAKGSGGYEHLKPIGADHVAVAKRPYSEDLHPCEENCHSDIKANPKPRKLPDHDPIGQIVLDHGPKDRWCFDCHNPGNRDYLRLVNGKLITFQQSYVLCGQCHGPKLRDWRAGIHGKRTGMWNGKKQYLLCAHCHNPHSPRYKPRKPCPAPIAPSELHRALPNKAKPCPKDLLP